jgi:hypothetical protein
MKRRGMDGEGGVLLLELLDGGPGDPRGGPCGVGILGCTMGFSKFSGFNGFLGFPVFRGCLGFLWLDPDAV